LTAREVDRNVPQGSDRRTIKSIYKGNPMSNGIISTLLGTGILLANVILGTADAQSKKSTTFPPIDPSRVDCTAFRTGNEAQCYRTANEVYQLNLLILSEYEAGDFDSAGQDVLPNTPQMFPDGTVIYGVGSENFPVIANLVGSNDFAFESIDDEFWARVLDKNTVILFGDVVFTVMDNEHGGMVRIIHNAQTEMFRRNPQMPRGWELVYEQIGYITPLLGDR
jgi:hypothetical protein